MYTAPDLTSTPGMARYKIGTDFCLEFNGTSIARTVVDLRCDVINTRDNRPTGVPQVFPEPPQQTWDKDGLTYYSLPTAVDPIGMINSEFFMTYPLLMLGLPAMPRNPLQPSPFIDGSLIFTSTFTFGNLTMSVLPPGVTRERAERTAFENLLGTWTCSLNNSLGTETCSSRVRECGEWNL